MLISDTAIDVHGWIRVERGASLFVLAERLSDHDTFLTGALDIEGARLPVRILTLDDVTVLRPTTAPPRLPGSTWSGVLHLPHGLRAARIPNDLEDALKEAEIDTADLDPRELRHLLTYLGESTTPAVRRERIATIVGALGRTNT